MSEQLDAEDAACVDAWLDAGLRAPGVLPAGFEPVQTRLVRSVGRARLPGGGSVYLKTMGFPRARDRWRYWLRAMPGPHEGEMLRSAAAAGVPCPRVLGTRGKRRPNGMPLASVLATAGLPLAPGPPPTLGECAQLTRRLIAAGIAHRDLHAGNFVRLADGGCAVLDLQSARRAWTAIAPLPLAVRLLAAEWSEKAMPLAVVEAGLLSAAALPVALSRARALRVRFVRRRVERCRLESTEFTVCRRPWGRLSERRALRSGGHWQHGGKELVRVWLGARFLEVAAGEPSPLLALFESGTIRRRASIYVDPALSPDGFDARRGAWLDAHRRLRELGQRAAPLDPSLPLPWSGRVATDPTPTEIRFDRIP